MMSVDELCNATIPQVLQYHGLRHNECPINPCHELTLVSGTYAMCHSCGVEWDVLGLHFDLGEINTLPQEEQSQAERFGDTAPEFSAITVDEQEKLVSTIMEIIGDFAGWVRSNRQHIMGAPDYDGDSVSSIGFLTLKGNLCLLPWVTECLTHGQIRKLEEVWKEHNFIRFPKDGRGLKRSERIPVDIRKVLGCSPTMKLYTFHRRETLQILGYEDKYSVNTVSHTA